MENFKYCHYCEINKINPHNYPSILIYFKIKSIRKILQQHRNFKRNKIFNYDAHTQAKIEIFRKIKRDEG